MDMKLLRTFATAARTLNFHKAAEQLFLSQPTVTQHIRLLETELRANLFDRGGRRVRLTAAGERFLAYADQVLALYEKGVQELTIWQKGYRDRLILAVSPLIARSTLPHIIKRYTTEHPDIEVVVQIELSGEIAPLVSDGRAHLGLSRIPAISRDLESEIWYSDPVTLVVPQGTAPGARLPDWRSLLAANRLLTHNHPIYWEDLLQAIHQQGIRVRSMEVSLVDITKIFIEEGLGVSFLPISTVTTEMQQGRLLAVPTPGLELPTAATYLIYPSQGPSAPAGAFINLLK